MPLNDIVNVQISYQTATISEAGFGIPMILGTNVRFTELIRFYSNMDGVALDFASTDPEYIAAQDIFSQVISPELIAIGRRLVDNVNFEVLTALPGATYTFNVNGQEIPVTTASTTTYSTVTINQDLVAGNRINVSVDGDLVGTVTSEINFDIDFVASNSIVATINGTPIAAVPFSTDQATTMANLATALQATAAVATATVTGPRQITATFASAGDNTINSVVTTLGATQPQATIYEGAFEYAVSSLETMQDIRDAINLMPGITATISGSLGRVLTVEGAPATTVTVNSFVVEGGASQATASIVNIPQAITNAQVIASIIAAFNAQILADPSFPLQAVSTGSDTFILNNRFPGVAYSLRVGNTISNPNNARVRITQVLPNADYTVTVNGIPYSYRTLNLVQDSNTIINALVALINADLNMPVSAVNLGDGTFTLTSANLNQGFSLAVTDAIMQREIGIYQLPLVAVNAVGDDLTLINDADNSWYALISTTRDPATVRLIADWVEARIKLFGTASADPDIINVPAGTDTSSIAAQLNQAGYVRTFVMYHQDADFDYPEAAWFGRVLPLDPGSETWKFKTLNSITYSNLTTTQSLNALNKSANTYEFVAGVGITQNGTVAQGEFIDIIRGVDWLRARVQEYVFAVLVNNPKVPYTDAGIGAIEAQVKRALSLGVSNGFISDDPPPTVTVPRAADVPPADKAARILRNVRFFATLSGAIHAVRIIGTLSV
jgi:hypothetical protein